MNHNLNNDLLSDTDSDDDLSTTVTTVSITGGTYSGTNAIGSSNTMSSFNGTCAVDLSSMAQNNSWWLNNASTISIAQPDLTNTLSVMGDANFEGDLKIRGKSLLSTLDAIEKRLAILNHNTELEDKWAELRELGEKYRELEKSILAQEELYKILER